MRSIPDPGFAGDDGSIDPALSAALAAYDVVPEVRRAEQHNAVLAALQDARLLVPVVALLGEVEHDVPAGGRARSGQPREKTSDMASVLMTGRDGRTALLAFTGTGALTRWNPEARPVPVGAQQAARAAVQDEASALLVDVAGPVLFVVEGVELDSLARGHRLLRVQGRWAWTSSDVQ